MEIGDRCVIFPLVNNDFKPYSTYLKNIENNIIEIEMCEGKNFSIGENIIVEFVEELSLKRYKGSVRKTGKSSMICIISEHSERDRKFTRVDVLYGMLFRLWSERNRQYKGLCTNISGNGMVISTEASSYPGEMIMIEKLKIPECENLNENIVGRVIKFKSVENDDEGYNQIVINFIYINEIDRNNIVTFVNKRQKEIKEKGYEDEFDDLSFLEDFF